MEHEVQSKVRTAIILAPDENGRLPVFGIPSVRRLVLLALQIGVQTIHVVGHVGSIRPILSDLLPSEAFHPVEDPERLDQVVNGLAPPPGDGVLVLKANHVVDKHSLARLTETAAAENLYCLGAKERGELDGIYVVPRVDLVPLLKIAWSPPPGNSSLLDKAHRVRGASGLPHLIKNGKDGVKLSETKLTAALSYQTAAGDGFLARHIDRRFSRFFSERLAHTPLTPNQITLAGVAIGLAGALLLSQPGYWPQLAGSLLFLFCVVVDGVDGELARLKLLETPFGHALDVVTDNIVHVAIFVGIAFGLYRDTGQQRYLHFLGLLLGGFGFCAVAVYYTILKRTPEEAKQSSKTARFMTLLTNRDFAYLVVAFALIHRLNWFLMGTTAGTYLFAATLWTMHLHEKRKVSD
jgi:phosphatidylglycerophosphate synthase